MSYNYAGWLAAAANLAGTTTTQPNFVIEVPNAIDYGEMRIFRDLDLIATVTTDTSQTCTPSNRQANVPGGFITVSAVNIITPAGATAAGGKRNQCVVASQDLMDFMFSDATYVGVPSRYHVLTQGYGGIAGACILGPWPDQNYTIEYRGTQRPAPLSASNQTTFLSTVLPDLFLLATMIHISAYQKNWSALGSDPQSGATYEVQYKSLLKGCSAEEMRKRYVGSAAFPPWGFDTQPTTPDQ